MSRRPVGYKAPTKALNEVPANARGTRRYGTGKTFDDKPGNIRGSSANRAPRRQSEPRRGESERTSRRTDTNASVERRWGSVARHGARVLNEEERHAQFGAPPQRRDPRIPPDRARNDATSSRATRTRVTGTRRQVARAPLGGLDERVLPSDIVRSDASARHDVSPEKNAPARAPRALTGVTRAARRYHSDDVDLPDAVALELADAASYSTSRRDISGDLARRLSRAAGAYERDRYADALRIVKPLLSQAPHSTAVRELYGLTCYRLGRWEEAIKHLEIVEAAAGDETQLPVLMDSYRALGRRKKVDELWERLKKASPDADVLVEGRLVLASTLARSGDLEGAIGLLVHAGAARDLRRPAERHVRQWYVLADLFEASGDIPRARELFERVVRADPALADAPERLASLGPTRKSKPTPRPARARSVGR